MKSLIFLLLIFISINVSSQEESIITDDEQILEEHTEWLEDLYQKFDEFRSHPLDINQITEQELSVFPFISAIQIHQLIEYRKLLGPLEEILEMQAIPGWDVETIKRLKPFVVIKIPGSKWDRLKSGIQKNEQLILYRTNFDNLLNFSNAKPTGSALLRYRFTSSTVHAGLQVEKDKGEKWWIPRKGLPFISGYCSIKTEGIIKQILIGDFLVSMGQGLVLGMGRSVIKSTAAMQIKRQISGILPYRSTDENRYMRGMGLTFQKSVFRGTFFVSSNNIDGNLVEDSLSKIISISSLQTSGLHISASEILDWDAVRVNSFGSILGVRIPNGNISFNQAYHHFDKPLLKQSLPYNLHSMRGNIIKTESIEFSKTIYNTHFFGEFALGSKNQKSFVLGFLSSLNKSVDFSFLIRSYDVGFHSYLSRSFGENSVPSNEKGIYAGLSLKLFPGIQLDSYIDMFAFPWLKYRVDKPSKGRDQVVQLIWKPDKKTILSVRYKDETKYINEDMLQPLHWVGSIRKMGLRSQMEHHPALNWKWRARIEYSKVQWERGVTESGILFFVDLFWSKADFSLNGRLMFCNTEGFESRIYAYENDVLYYGHTSQFQGRQVRSYLNVEWKISNKFSVYTKISSNYIRSEWVIKL